MNNVAPQHLVQDSTEATARFSASSVSRCLEALLKLKLIVPEINSGAEWLPPYAPYIPGLGPRIPAKCMLLCMAPEEYLAVEGREMLLEKIRNCENQALFGHANRDKIVFYKVCREFLGAIDARRHGNYETDPYWKTVLGSIVADLQRVGSPGVPGPGIFIDTTGTGPKIPRSSI